MAYVTARDVAAHLGVHFSTVYRLAHTGDIPAIRVGRAWRFDLDAVDAELTKERDPWAQSPRSLARQRHARADLDA